MTFIKGMIACALVATSGAAAAQGQPPVVELEKHDSEIVFVTVTTLMACGTPASELSTVGNRFSSWMDRHTIGGKPATESYMARTRKAGQAYRNPQAKAFLCARAESGKARMLADANAAMARLDREHVSAHRG
jgi:hypothetical protein